LNAQYGITIWDNQEWLLYLILSWVLVVVLSLLGILRIIGAVRVGWKGMRRKVDVTSVSGAEEDSNVESKAEILSRGIGVMTGRSLWKKQFLEEPGSMRSFRSISAMLIVISTSLFALFALFVDPVRETAFTPVRELQSESVPLDLKGSGMQTVWNVVLTRMTQINYDSNGNPYTFPDTNFSAAVQVVPLWDGGGGPNCSDISSSLSTSASAMDLLDPSLHLITFNCPPRGEAADTDLQAYFWADQLASDFYQDALPDLLVIVNFTKLNIPIQNITDIPANSVQVRLGLTNDTVGVVKATPPTIVLPGTNQIGITRLVIRQRSKTPRFSAFGLFSNSVDTVALSEMAQVMADPIAGPSPSSRIPRAPDIGTIRISYADFFSDWKIVQDHRENTVLNGFSAVGGLWAFLGGAFTMLYGSSLMRVLLGIKPLSVFGMVYRFQTRQHCLTEYPQAQSDMAKIKAERGFLAILCDHLVETNILVDGAMSSASDSESARPTTREGNEKVELEPLLPTSGPSPSIP
jgi:hypothetical protein